MRDEDRLNFLLRNLHLLSMTQADFVERTKEHKDDHHQITDYQRFMLNTIYDEVENNDQT